MDGQTQTATVIFIFAYGPDAKMSFLYVFKDLFVIIYTWSTVLHVQDYSLISSRCFMTIDEAKKGSSIFKGIIYLSAKGFHQKEQYLSLSF